MYEIRNLKMIDIQNKITPGIRINIPISNFIIRDSLFVNHKVDPLGTFIPFRWVGKL